jgi:hypothetical protein
MLPGDVEQGPSRRKIRILRPSAKSSVKVSPRKNGTEEAKEDKKLKEKVEVRLERLHEDAINPLRRKSGEVACYVCNRKFKLPQQRDHHMKTHRPNRHSCPKCHKTFSSAFGVRRHMALHGKDETEGTP